MAFPERVRGINPPNSDQCLNLDFEVVAWMSRISADQYYSASSANQSINSTVSSSRELIMWEEVYN